MSDEKRELLERSANRTRARLIETIEALDHRRHEVMDVKTVVKKQVHEHWKPLAIVGGVFVVGIGTIIGVSVYWAATRRERLRRERWQALRRFWFHPERLAQKEKPKGSLAWEIGRKVLGSTLTFFALQLAKRAVQRALPPPGTEVTRRTDVVVRTLPA